VAHGVHAAAARPDQEREERVHACGEEVAEERDAEQEHEAALAAERR